MADLKITQLSAQASATDDDLLAIVNDPSGTPETNKITKAAFLKGTAAESRTVLAANATVVASAALADITGLNVAVSAGGLYKLDAMLVLNRGAASSINGYGLTFPTMNLVRGTYYISTSTYNGIGASVNVRYNSPLKKVFTGNSASGSIIVSLPGSGVVQLSGLGRVEAIMDVANDGVVQLQAKAAGGTSALTIVAGSFIEVKRLN